MSSAELTGMVGEIVWHMDCDVLLWVVIRPIEGLVKYIRNEHPDHEIETRLRLLRPVKGELPSEVVAALKAHSAALEVFGAAREAYDDALRPNLAAQVARDHAKTTDTAWKVCTSSGVLHASRESCFATYEALAAATSRHAPEINVLHELECGRLGCPWTPEKPTIFPEAG